MFFREQIHEQDLGASETFVNLLKLNINGSFKDYLESLTVAQQFLLANHYHTITNHLLSW